MLARLWNRPKILILLLAISLDVLFAALGWRSAVVLLTALIVGSALVYLMLLVRETYEIMDRYGVSSWESGPSRPPCLPIRPPVERPGVPEATRLAAPSRLPDVVATVNRAAVLLLITTTVLTLRTVMALHMLPH